METPELLDQRLVEHDRVREKNTTVETRTRRDANVCFRKYEESHDTRVLVCVQGQSLYKQALTVLSLLEFVRCISVIHGDAVDDEVKPRAVPDVLRASVLARRRICREMRIHR